MKALRDTKNKPDWAMLFKYFPMAMPELCKARMFGARYYTKDGADGRDNWLNSIGTDHHVVFMDGCIRGSMSHLLKFLWGEERDQPQDNVHHLAFSALNALMALEYALAGSSPVEDQRLEACDDTHEFAENLAELERKNEILEARMLQFHEALFNVMMKNRGLMITVKEEQEIWKLLGDKNERSL